ncbi:MAG: tetratricopeptide repeat protein [Bacteroidota bacterium]
MYYDLEFEKIKQLIALKKYALARERLYILLKTEPNSSEIYQIIGGTYAKELKHKAAKEYLEKSLKLDPSNNKALNYLGSIALKEERHNEAEELLKRSLRLDPQQTDALTILAQKYLKSVELEKCNELCNRALKIDPNYVDALLLKSAMQLLKNEHKPALETVMLALKQDPSNSLTHIALAITLKKSGKKEARDHIKQALANSPDNADIHQGIRQYLKQNSFAGRYISFTGSKLVKSKNGCVQIYSVLNVLGFILIGFCCFILPGLASEFILFGILFLYVPTVLFIFVSGHLSGVLIIREPLGRLLLSRREFILDAFYLILELSGLILMIVGITSFIEDQSNIITLNSGAFLIHAVFAIRLILKVKDLNYKILSCATSLCFLISFSSYVFLSDKFFFSILSSAFAFMLLMVMGAERKSNIKK